MKLLLIFFCLSFFLSCQERPTQHTTITQKALEFLKQSQSRDGSFDPNQFGGNYKSQEGKIAITSLALLAFLSEPNMLKLQIKSCLNFLLPLQKKDGSIADHNYANAITLLAFTECQKYGLLEEKYTTNLAKYLQSKQSSVGAWDYTEANQYRNDLSITGWVFLAFNNLNNKTKKLINSDDSITALQNMLDIDKSGPGSTEFNNKANTYYTYGINPNEEQGRVKREAGSTIQSIVLMIRSFEPKYFLTPWVEQAKKDQMINFNPTKKIGLYKLFFNVHSKINWKELNPNWDKNVHTNLKQQQQTNGSWLPNDHPTSFGGTIFSTSLAILILNHQNLR